MHTLNELEPRKDLEPIDSPFQFPFLLEEQSEKSRQIARHKAWLLSIRHERPSTDYPYRIGVYNQTKHENYLAYHKKQYIDSINLCPKWTLVDFYVDEGASAPRMETSENWSRLLSDCMDGKIDLIITQKVSNVSRNMDELTLCSRILAAHCPPIGIYFISEDIFTLASYYQEDLRDTGLLPSDSLDLLPEESEGAILS